jgi:hypothetical protein
MRGGIDGWARTVDPKNAAVLIKSYWLLAPSR